MACFDWLQNHKFAGNWMFSCLHIPAVHSNDFHLLFLLQMISACMCGHSYKCAQQKESFFLFLINSLKFQTCFSLLTLFTSSAIWCYYKHINITRLHYSQKQGVPHYFKSCQSSLKSIQHNFKYTIEI